MRSLTLWLLPATLLAVACDHSAAPTAPIEMPAPANATEPTQVFRVDESHTFIGCNGDEILVHNVEQVVFFFRGTPEQGHLQVHVIEINSTATNLTTGEVQTFHGADKQSANGDFTGEFTPGEFTGVLHQTFTSPGTQATQIFRRFHITVNQNGEVTALHSDVSPECT